MPDTATTPTAPDVASGSAQLTRRSVLAGACVSCVATVTACATYGPPTAAAVRPGGGRPTGRRVPPGAGVSWGARVPPCATCAPATAAPAQAQAPAPASGAPAAGGGGASGAGASGGGPALTTVAKVP